MVYKTTLTEDILSFKRLYEFNDSARKDKAYRTKLIYYFKRVSTRIANQEEFDVKLLNFLQKSNLAFTFTKSLPLFDKFTRFVAAYSDFHSEKCTNYRNFNIEYKLNNEINN